MLGLLKVAEKIQNTRTCTMNFFLLHLHFTEQCVFYLSTPIYINVILYYIIFYNEDILANQREKSIEPHFLSKAICFLKAPVIFLAL